MKKDKKRVSGSVEIKIKLRDDEHFYNGLQIILNSVNYFYRYEFNKSFSMPRKKKNKFRKEVKQKIQKRLQELIHKHLLRFDFETVHGKVEIRKKENEGK